ncbi:MAG: hypothetical protein ABSB88_06080 [Bryobacteraceae bacterium]|jgi:hypothetical protein
MKRLLAILYATSMWAATTTVSQSVVGPNNQPASGQALIRLSAACKSSGSYVGQQTIAVKFTATPPTGQTNNFNVALIPNDTCIVSGPTPAGWSGTVAYWVGNSVTYGTQTWLAIAASTGVAPGSDPRKWALVSTSYTVSWTLTGGPSWTETWIVPTSGTAVSVDSVKVAQANLPTIAGVILMTGGSGSLTYTTTPGDGQYIRWNASMNAWQPVTFVDQETVSGTIDGTNVTFTLANAPGPSAGLVLFRNGIVQKAGQDYTLSGNTVTFVTAATPQPDDTLLAWYRY